MLVREFEPRMSLRAIRLKSAQRLHPTAGKAADFRWVRIDLHRVTKKDICAADVLFGDPCGN